MFLSGGEELGWVLDEQGWCDHEGSQIVDAGIQLGEVAQTTVWSTVLVRLLRWVLMLLPSPGRHGAFVVCWQSGSIRCRHDHGRSMHPGSGVLGESGGEDRLACHQWDGVGEQSLELKIHRGPCPRLGSSRNWLHPSMMRFDVA